MAFIALSTTKNTFFTEQFITSYFRPMNIAKVLRTPFYRTTPEAVFFADVIQVFLKVSHTSQESTRVGVESPTQVFSCEVCKIFKNKFFTEHLW